MTYSYEVPNDTLRGTLGNQEIAMSKAYGDDEHEENEVFGLFEELKCSLPCNFLTIASATWFSQRVTGTSVGDISM